MPFRSKSQIAKFKELVASGRISQAIFDEWLGATPKTHTLPERVEKKQKSVKPWKAKVHK